MFKILKNFNKKEWGLIIACVFLVAGQVYLDLKLPDYMSEITMLVQTEGSTMAEILASGGWMLLCALGSLLCTFVVAAIAAKVASSLAARLREMTYDKVQSFSMQEINGFSTSSLITRSTNDVTQIQQLIVMGLQVMLRAPIMAVWAIVKIAGKSWQWTFSTGVSVVVLIGVVGICVAIAMPRFKKLQVQTDDLNAVARENLTGLRVVRAYNAEGYQEEKFEGANEELTKTNQQANMVMATIAPTITMIMSGLTLAIYWVGAALIQSAAMADKMLLFSDMVVFSTYAMQVVMSFMMLVMIFILLPRATVSAKRINEVLDTEATILDGEMGEVPAGREGEVEFRNVSFRYGYAEEYVLKDVSFKAERGETVAFIGSTGSGKSTVINLVPRFYDATEGEVLVDGVNVKDYTQQALRNKIGYVSQHAQIFSCTVSGNVSMGDNGRSKATTSEIADAVYVAEASEFVEGMEGTFDADIAQGGTNLSGGQKQRLSIARAVCRQPEIFIFDDSFSALDYKTDRKLRSNLKKECANSTQLIVAQRIGTIKDADKIVVLDEGKVVGMGTHNELMASCPTYQEIAYSQLAKEELA